MEASAFPQPTHRRSGLQSHIITVKIDAQRDVSVGDLQTQVDQAIDGSLQLGGIILTHLGTHG